MPNKEMFHIGMVPPPAGTPQQLENSKNTLKAMKLVDEARIKRIESMKDGAKERYEDWEITYQRHKKVFSHLDQHRQFPK